MKGCKFTLLCLLAMDNNDHRSSCILDVRKGEGPAYYDLSLLLFALIGVDDVKFSTD
jgi:hypothetical protein